MALSWNALQPNLCRLGPEQEQAPRGVIVTYESVAVFQRVKVRNRLFGRSSSWCCVAGEKEYCVSSLRGDPSIWETGVPGSEND